MTGAPFRGAPATHGDFRCLTRRLSRLRCACHLRRRQRGFALLGSGGSAAAKRARSGPDRAPARPAAPRTTWSAEADDTAGATHPTTTDAPKTPDRPLGRMFHHVVRPHVGPRTDAATRPPHSSSLNQRASCEPARQPWHRGSERAQVAARYSILRAAIVSAKSGGSFVVARLYPRRRSARVPPKRR
jgi:hypothetical protein